MIQSNEVRWFFESVPDTLVQWFQRKGLDLMASKSSRADFYLPFSSNKGLSIKLREGHLEIKKLLKQSGKRKFVPGNIEGKVQHWVKWRFSLDEQDALAKSIIVEKKYDWIEVYKNRIGFKYQFDLKGKLLGEKGIEELIPEGCQVELTRLKIKDKEFFSFGLESFSETEHFPQYFNKAIKLVAKELAETNELIQPLIPPIQLPAEMCMSYPEFLEHISFGIML